MMIFNKLPKYREGFALFYSQKYDEAAEFFQQLYLKDNFIHTLYLYCISRMLSIKTMEDRMNISSYLNKLSHSLFYKKIGKELEFENAYYLFDYEKVVKDGEWLLKRKITAKEKPLKYMLAHAYFSLYKMYYINDYRDKAYDLITSLELYDEERDNIVGLKIEILTSKRMFDEAYKVLETNALRLSDPAFYDYNNLIILARSMGDSKEVDSLLKKMYTSPDLLEDALYEVFFHYLAKGDYDKAIYIIDELLRKYPKEKYYVAKASILNESKSYREAISFITHNIDKIDNKSIFYFLLADTYFHLPDKERYYNEIIEYAKKSIFDKLTIEPIIILGETYIIFRKEEELRKLINMYPEILNDDNAMYILLIYYFYFKKDLKTVNKLLKKYKFFNVGINSVIDIGFYGFGLEKKKLNQLAIKKFEENKLYEFKSKLIKYYGFYESNPITYEELIDVDPNKLNGLEKSIYNCLTLIESNPLKALDVLNKERDLALNYDFVDGYCFTGLALLYLEDYKGNKRSGIDKDIFKAYEYLNEEIQLKRGLMVKEPTILLYAYLSYKLNLNLDNAKELLKKMPYRLYQPDRDYLLYLLENKSPKRYKEFLKSLKHATRKEKENFRLVLEGIKEYFPNIIYYF